MRISLRSPLYRNLRNYLLPRLSLFLFICLLAERVHVIIILKISSNRCNMLSSLLKEHQAKQTAWKASQDQKRKDAISAANDLTQALVDHLNVGVAQAYLNQKKLDAEAKQLYQSAATFAKQTQQWLLLVGSFSSALKEIGDVENWSKSIESDMKTITTALEYAYKVSQDAPL